MVILKYIHIDSYTLLNYSEGVILKSMHYNKYKIGALPEVNDTGLTEKISVSIVSI